MKTATWGCECNRQWIEGKETKKGKPKWFHIDVRKMHIRDLIYSYRVILVKRKGEKFYCVSQLVEPKKELWPTLKLTDAKEKAKWLREGTYTREMFIAWLRKRILNAEAAVSDLDTCPVAA